VIISTGIDIVEVYRIRQTIERTPRFVERVFTEAERAYCDAKRAASAQSYAARFAAKEATLKALKTGWRGKLTWHDVEVESGELGIPSLKISGEAKKLFDDLGATVAHLSLSHTTETAIAMVILEGI
jgi:holo-[acyl-carrier protein] synthase